MAGPPSIFSTSDGSDPNANGRRYTLSLGAPTLRAVGFGSCHLSDAMIEMGRKGLAHCAWRTPVLSYTPREASQLIGFYTGELAIPAWLRPLTVADAADPAAPQGPQNRSGLMQQMA